MYLNNLDSKLNVVGRLKCEAVCTDIYQRSQERSRDQLAVACQEGQSLLNVEDILLLIPLETTSDNISTL